MPFALNKYKDFFSLPKEANYLNCAAQGPLCRAASEAVKASLNDKEYPLRMDHNYGLERVQKCREAVSKLIDWPAQNIALANSTGWGINIIANAMNLKSGDEVLTFEGQFPSNVIPWHTLEEKGVRVTKALCPGHIADLRALEQTISQRTKVVSLEWVHFISGDRIPLEEIAVLCRKKNIRIVVDVTQGLGAIPFSMKKMGVDAVVCSTYKWLYAPYGSGFMAFSGDFLSTLSTPFLNWLTLDTQWTDNLAVYDVKVASCASRYDVFAQMGYMNLDGMTAALDWMNTLDIEENFRNIQGLIDLLKQELNPKNFKIMNQGPSSRQSCIATFTCKDVNTEKLMQNLNKENFTCCIRAGGVRISPSLYNDPEQIQRFCKIANAVGAT